MSAKRLVGGGGQMLTFADKVGGWRWPNAGLRKKEEKKYPTKKCSLHTYTKKKLDFCDFFQNFFISIFFQTWPYLL